MHSKSEWPKRASAKQIAQWRDSLPSAIRPSFDKAYKRAKAEDWDCMVRGKNDCLAMAEGCYFSWHKAQVVADFFPQFLVHSIGKWRGQPFHLMEWQKWDVIYPIFGWLKSNGKRRHTRAYVEIPKKNGKSALASGIGLYMLVADGEGAPEVYSGAVNGNQADMIHKVSRRMVKASPKLSKVLKVNDNMKFISYPKTDGVFKVLSEEVEAHEGLNVSCALIDEVHVHKTSKLLDTLWYGGDARAQFLFFMITTAGEYNETSIGWETHQYAQRVLSGDNEDIEYYAVIYAADKDDDLKKPEVWAKANPSLGVAIEVDRFDALLREAKNNPRKWNDVRRYRFNIWVQAAEAYFDVEQYKLCGDDFGLADMEGRTCYGGMDLSSSDDLSCFALCFSPISDDPFYRFLEWFWIPEDTLPNRAEMNQQPYRQWVEAGWIKTTPGDIIDLRYIHDEIVKIGQLVNIQEIAYDKHRATEIMQNLMDDGFEMVEFAQNGSNYTAPMERYDQLMRRREMRHCKNPAMIWQVGNVIAKSLPNGLIYPIKYNVTKREMNRKRKIDGAVSHFMGLARAIMRETDGCVYDTRGVLTV